MKLKAKKKLFKDEAERIKQRRSFVIYYFQKKKTRIAMKKRQSDQRIMRKMEFTKKNN